MARNVFWPNVTEMCIQNVEAASMLFSELWMSIRVCITGLPWTHLFSRARLMCEFSWFDVPVDVRFDVRVDVRFDVRFDVRVGCGVKCGGSGGSWSGHNYDGDQAYAAWGRLPRLGWRLE